MAALERYAETEQGDVRKLTDVEPPEWRLRVGDWRVLFCSGVGAERSEATSCFKATVANGA
jgi:hypothetical protein